MAECDRKTNDDTNKDHQIMATAFNENSISVPMKRNLRDENGTSGKETVSGTEFT